MQSKATGAARDHDEPMDLKKESSSFADIAASIGTRNLMIIIVTMPLVFLAVVTVIIAVFGRDDEDGVASAPAERAVAVERLAEPAPVSAGATPVSPAAIGIDAGADITAMSLDGDRLALRVDGPTGVSIVIYDIANGAVIQRIPVTSAREN